MMALSCTKTPVTPKPPTDNEKFYCEINGERYRPDNKGDIFDQVLIADWYVSQGTFTVSAYNSRTYKDILLFVRLNKDKLIPKYYELENTNYQASYSGPYVKINNGTKSVKEDYNTIKGFINIIKVDTISKTVSGKFEFDAQSILDKTKFASIRNGQFNNLHY